MRRLVFIFTLTIICVFAKAQDDVEYRWEIGGGVGLMTYTGDFNSAILKGENSAFALSLMARRVFNPYSHLRMAFSYGTIKGKSGEVGKSGKGTDTFYPDYNTGAYSEADRPEYTFSNPVFDLGVMYEYNFWPYGTGREYRGAKRLTPFIAVGFGMTYASCKGGYTDASLIAGNELPPYGAPETTGSGVFTANLPLGFGVKYKVGARMNMSLEWMMHFSLSDKLDGVKDPYRIASDGIFKNTDCYSVLQLAVTYSFGPKCRTCMNSDWH